MRKSWKTMKKTWKQWENDEKLWKKQWKQWENDETLCKKQWKQWENHEKLWKNMKTMRKWWKTMKKTMKTMRKWWKTMKKTMKTMRKSWKTMEKNSENNENNEENDETLWKDFWKYVLFCSLDLIPIEYQNVLKHVFNKNRKKRNLKKKTKNAWFSFCSFDLYTYIVLKQFNNFKNYRYDFFIFSIFRFSIMFPVVVPRCSAPL